MRYRKVLALAYFEATSFGTVLSEDGFLLEDVVFERRAIAWASVSRVELRSLEEAFFALFAADLAVAVLDELRTEAFRDGIWISLPIGRARDDKPLLAF